MRRFTGDNDGDLRRATWDDLNYPGRIGTLMAAGLPMLQQRSPDARVAVQELIRRDGIGLLYRDAEHLAALLREDSRLTDAREAVAGVRHRFTFDEHADTLLRLFRTLAGR